MIPNPAASLVRRPLHVRETIATLIAADSFFSLAEARVRELHRELHDYIGRDGCFLHALEPVPVEPGAPPIVQRMAAAARLMGVGPMAAVAGGIAQLTVEALVEAGAEHVLFDNGGDIVMKIDRPVVVGIFTGPAKVRDIGFRIDPRPGIFSICTSSGTVGHSLSFGKADAATVIAADGFIADAAATALGNLIRSRTAEKEEIAAAIDALLLPDIEGLLVVAGERVGRGGNLPEIVNVAVDVSLVSGVEKR